MHPLISVAALNERLTNQNINSPDDTLVLVDCRHDLMDSSAGRRAYAEAHIPGAIHLHLDEDLSGRKTGKNGRHPLPEPMALAKRLADVGIGNDSTVIAYDAQGGMYAARLWWSLRWLGHDAVQVLDGGWQAWLTAGGASTTDVPQLPAATFTPNPQADHLVTVADVEANLTSQQFLVVDARAPGRYAGEGETIDPVAGHIPGTANRFFQENLDVQGCFKPATALREAWQNLLQHRNAAETIQQCGSGVTACHNLLALEVAGLRGARLYPGSWSEWCADENRPVAKGSR